jgi:hypothetical protein
MKWPPEELARFVAAYESGVRMLVLRKMFPDRSPGALAGKIVKLELKRPPRASLRRLATDNPAVVQGRSIFPSRVRNPADAPAVLSPGEWQRKLGRRVEKGAWTGMPIYSLSLEERATCPASCHHWRSCMGNGMQLAWRHRHGPELEERIGCELGALSHRHPLGFVIRLHVLGDFYSTDYVHRWGVWLHQFPALRIFGYTAWPPLSPIGRALADLNQICRGRFAIRWSSTEPGPNCAITIWEWPRSDNQLQSDVSAPRVIVCPAELGKTKGCGTCALCWSPAARDLTIGFIAHGGRS